MAVQIEGGAGLNSEERIAWAGLAVGGMVAMHLGCLAIFFLGCSWTAVGACAVAFFVRMFGITAGFHRYFSHHSYQTWRIGQFVLAWMGTASMQRGPLWWAAHHRYHHRYSDTPRDVHSPVAHGLWWSHVGWVLCSKYDTFDAKLVKDLARYPELCFLDRHFLLPPAMLALSMWSAGAVLQTYAPGLHTSAMQMVAYGFVLSTVLLYHATFIVNSLGHRFGSRRFPLEDNSRNNFWIALITLGDGYHNNHHYYPASARHGFFVWEPDVNYYLLRGLALAGLVWGIQKPPDHLVAEPERIGTRRLPLKEGILRRVRCSSQTGSSRDSLL
jgi:stearoyl-CoA desaturase (Delta-9 desaturase)